MAYLFFLIASILLIFISARIDKKRSVRLKNIEGDSYDSWVRYYNGRKKIYAIGMVVAFVPILNAVIATVSAIVLIAFISMNVMAMKFWDKLF